MATKISKEGLRLIKSFEGYHTRLPNGSCAAYQTYLGKDRFGRKKYDIPTIGYGCTKGVTMGMVWTEKQAEAALLKEIATFEAAVERLVKVPINQNEADALISFAYNLGEGNLAKSTLLKKLNKGDRAGAAKEFPKWASAAGVALDGLAARRMREAALFLKPVDKPTEPFMPQTVTVAAEPPSRATVATAAVGLASLAPATLPDVPPAAVDALSKAESWTDIGGRLWTLKSFGGAQPMLALGLILLVAAIWLWPRRAQ